MRLASKTLSGFSGNLLAYGASEVAAKASRLLVVVAVARTLDIQQIGLAAGVLATADILKSLTENGIGQRIIAARKDELEATCATAHRLFWAWCVGLAALQLIVAGIVYVVSGEAVLGFLIALLAAEYLFMPAGLVQAALAMREGKLRQTASIAGGQVVAANFLSALLALVWPSAMVLVLPRLLTAPFWLIAMRRLRPWTRDAAQGFAPVRPFVSFGSAVLGIEIVKALRLHSDKPLVGLLMGAEVLGLYFLAFNAGLGLATSFATAFSTVLFPHLCAAQDRVVALRQSLLLGMGLITPVVLAQAVLAPVYVPLLFGAELGHLSDIVAILCLAAIPTTLWSAAAGWMRANGQAKDELIATIGITVALTLNTLILAPFGLMTLATGYLAVASVTMVLSALPALSLTFAPQPRKV